MRVDLLDPPAYTPPYDRALAGGLVAAGCDVRLVTSRFAYGEVPPLPAGVQLDERFYSGARGRAASRGRALAKALGHVPAMARYRRSLGEGVDIVHAQWLTLPQIDRFLLPSGTPFVITAHDVLPREDRFGLAAGQKAVYAKADAVVVHSERGRQRLISEAGVDPAKIAVIGHGAFTHLRDVDPQLPPELPVPSTPLAVLPGLLREYKGIDVLLDAWRTYGDRPPGELWICGKARIEVPDPATLPAGVRLLDRFLSEAELAAVLRSADLVVLPYKEIDQSGVLYSALGLGRPLLLSDVGGFGEVAALGAAELVPAGSVAELAEALERLMSDGERRTVLSDNARKAADGPYSWATIASAHLDLYRSLIGT